MLLRLPNTILLMLPILCACLKMQAADSLQLVKSIPLVSGTFTTDKNGNMYIATKQAIYKYNSDGDSMAYYSNLRRGEISHIDATNPMQILLLNTNQNVITILDRLLVEKNKLDLKNIGVFNCTAISNSADGDIWVYADFKNELLKINEKLAITNTSFNLMQQFNNIINPVFITEQDRLLFLVDTTQGIIKMDAFGNYITTYHFKTKEVQYTNNQLVFIQDQQLVIYNTQSIKELKFMLPQASEVLQARVERNKLYVRYADKLNIYSL